MRIATVNVNGVRAAVRNGMPAWLESAQPDLVCLQEVRAPASVVDEAFASEWTVHAQACEIAGRAGVAILSRGALDDVSVGLPGLEGVPTHTGRWVEATVEGGQGPVRIVSAYVHSGVAGTPKMDDKYAFLDAMTTRMAALLHGYERVLIVGDVNVAHTERDIKNWRGNLKAAGFLPEERAYLDRWMGAGWIDVHRALAGDVDGPYTWWSQRGRAFDNDVGWRLDYHLASSTLASEAIRARVDRAASWDTRWSDHAPLIVDYS